jgi:ribosomal protein S18 acetylase RimI-like enzyme
LYESGAGGRAGADARNAASVVSVRAPADARPAARLHHVFRLRPATGADEDAVLALLAACDLAHYGEADFTREFLLDEWRDANFDAAADLVLIEDGRGEPVGCGALFSSGALAFVDPKREGAGAGSQLLAWAEARARACGRDVHRQRLAERNLGGRRLLTAAGYRQPRGVLWMQRALDHAPPLPPAPDGIVLETLDVARDARAIYAVDCAAFAGAPDYEQVPFASFHAEHLAGPRLDPSLSRVARRGYALVAFALCGRTERGGYIDILAVEQAERGRGLGALLLASAFAALSDAGIREARLDVSSENAPALRLYERAGMRVCNRMEVFEKPVG